MFNIYPIGSLENSKSLFTRDYFAGTPRLSPDQRYVAFRTSKKMFSQDYLALIDLKYGDVKLLVPMGFIDGFAWDLTGDRIVYQDTTTGECKIHLLTFNADKSEFTTEFLEACHKRSGYLSFAWFNSQEFYVNHVSDSKPVTPSNIPFHHLYSFDINSKKRQIVAKASDQSDFGFYSLEYDASTQTLYVLQANNFLTTDFYRYNNKKLVKFKTLNQYVPFYTVSNNKLIYKNPDKHFVLNNPADDFTNQQAFLRPQPQPINEPHLSGDQLVFIAGNNFGNGMHRWHNGQLSDVNLANHRPVALASFAGNLIFSSDNTGITQIYQLLPNGEIQKLSNMQVDDYIQYIEVKDDLFVVSHKNRVDIYRFKNQQLQLINSLPGYHRSAIAADGKTLLLSKTDDNGSPMVIEKSLANLNANKQQIDDAQLAFYHKKQVVYLNQDKELIRLADDNRYLIATKVDVSNIKYNDVQGDYFYFVERAIKENRLIKLNLINGKKTIIPLNGRIPSRIEAIDDALYIRTVKVLTPTLVTGKLDSGD